MQLLIVHRDAEMGEQLVRMVREYTGYECDLVGNDVSALDWGLRHAKCGLLLTQLEPDGIDSALSEIFTGLQPLFFPPYAGSERRLEVAETNVFPEPIDGDALLDAIEEPVKAGARPRDLFHVVDIVQMCCLARRSGAIQIVKDKKSGLLFLRSGRLLHAEAIAACGTNALFETVGWDYVEFAYDQSVRPRVETIGAPWDEALIEAVTLHKQQRNLTSARRRRA